jgi:1A family penicillin-binding protein
MVLLGNVMKNPFSDSSSDSSGRTRKYRGKQHRIYKYIKPIILIAVVLFLFGAGALILWLSTLKIPDLQSFDQHALSESTRIYDKTGQTLLYNVNQDTKRTVVPFDQISPYLKEATIAIEDSSFYSHGGIKISSIIRAFFADLFSGSFSQGGSTITQQVVKNSLLTGDKTISRKIKEWVLAIKLERIMDKDSILNLYLNGTPYGGTMYGVEEASESYFGVHAKDVTLAQAAYIAAMPQAPTYYSPYGPNVDALEQRKNLVLEKMLENKLITQDQYNEAIQEKVVFKPQDTQSIKAPHFVNYILNYLNQKYGTDAVQNGGLKVITTLDYDLQTKAEEVVSQFAPDNEKNFNAGNEALVAVDPTTGGILAMVGSKDYFDTADQGQFNVATAHRQPGSAFKPFVYSVAFNMGYTPDTVLFDAETEFSANCDPSQPVTAGTGCYRPVNYDGIYRGPISIRNALAQSINIPAVKTLYLVGVDNAIRLAKDMGIQGLSDSSQYGLTLVLGGGEVSPLDMASAYSVFANDGVKNPQVSILEVDDRDGNVLEKFTPNPTRVLPEQTTREISDILSDNVARTPAYGATSALYFPDRDVAVKTGTTNDSRDAWIIGYTPQISVAAWAGNNDNSPMVKKVAGLIIAPMWRAFMDKALDGVPPVPFIKPDPIDPNTKPVLKGEWEGGTYTIDKTTGEPSTDQTPDADKETVTETGIHDILYWVNKADPTGLPPANPYSDPQFSHWEYGVQQWLATHYAAPSAQNTPETPAPLFDTQTGLPLNQPVAPMPPTQ